MNRNLGIILGCLIAVPLIILAVVIYPPHWRYEGSKLYEQIAQEYWQDKDYVIFRIFDKSAQELEKREFFAIANSEEIKGSADELWRGYCLKKAKEYWGDAKQYGGGGWDIPKYLALANYYLTAINTSREEIGMTDEAVGIELFDYYVISFKGMLGAHRGEYTIPPPYDYESMKSFLEKAGLTYPQLGVDQDEWLEIKLRG